MERDEILTLLKDEKFDILIRKIKNATLFEKLSDDFVFRTIFDENILDEINKSSRDEDFKAMCIYMLNDLHIQEEHPFKFKKSKIDFVGNILISNFPTLKIAEQFPDHPKSKPIIENFKEVIDREINESRIKREFLLTQISQQSFQSKKYSRSIFNSPQEKYLFEALIEEVNGEFLVIPNIALPTIISNEIFQKLHFEENEKEFFYKSSVDISIVDKVSYEVLLVVELDSSFHDSLYQAEKDEMKNKIFELSEIEMFRIRQKDWSQNPDYNEIAISILEKVKKNKADYDNLSY